MRGLILCSLLLIVLGIGFGFGIGQNLTALSVAGFCLSPFALIGLGWSLRGVFAGRRLALVAVEDPPLGHSRSRTLDARRERVGSDVVPNRRETL